VIALALYDAFKGNGNGRTESALAFCAIEALRSENFEVLDAIGRLEAFPAFVANPEFAGSDADLRKLLHLGTRAVTWVCNGLRISPAIDEVIPDGAEFGASGKPDWRAVSRLVEAGDDVRVMAVVWRNPDGIMVTSQPGWARETFGSAHVQWLQLFGWANRPSLIRAAIAGGMKLSHEHLAAAERAGAKEAVAQIRREIGCARIRQRGPKEHVEPAIKPVIEFLAAPGDHPGLGGMIKRLDEEFDLRGVTAAVVTVAAKKPAALAEFLAVRQDQVEVALRLAADRPDDTFRFFMSFEPVLGRVQELAPELVRSLLRSGHGDLAMGLIDAFGVDIGTVVHAAFTWDAVEVCEAAVSRMELTQAQAVQYLATFGSAKAARRLISRVFKIDHAPLTSVLARGHWPLLMVLWHGKHIDNGRDVMQMAIGSILSSPCGPWSGSESSRTTLIGPSHRASAMRR
jgi:hypothetical protein